MDITALQTLLDSLALLQQQVVDAQLLIDQAYKKGFDEGVASVSIPADKIYNEEELQAKIAEAVAPLQKKIDEFEATIIDVDQKIQEAIATFKADLLVKVKEVDAIEDAQLEALLK